MAVTEQEAEKSESRSSGRTKRNTRRTSSAENLANTTDSSKEDSMADDFASKIPYRKPVRGRKRKANEEDEPEDSALVSEPSTLKKSGRGSKSPSKSSQSPSKSTDKPERQSSRNRQKSGHTEPNAPPTPVTATTSVQGKPTAVVGPVRPEGEDDNEDSSKSKKRGRPSKKDKAKEKDDENEIIALQRIANGLRKRKTDKIAEDSVLFGGDSKLTALHNELVVAPPAITKTNDKELLKVDDKIRPQLTVKPTGVEQLERDWEEEKKEESTGEKNEDKPTSSQWTEVKDATAPSSGRSIILKTNKSLIIKPFPKVSESDMAKTPPIPDQTQSLVNPEESETKSKNDNVETEETNENSPDKSRTDITNVRNMQETKQIDVTNKKKESNEHIYLTEEEIAKLPIDICAKKPGSHYPDQSNLAPSMSEVDLEPPGLPADLADVMPSLDAALAMCRDKEQKKSEAEEIQKIRDSLLLDKETTKPPPTQQFRQDYSFPQIPPQDIYKDNMLGWQTGGPSGDHQYMKQPTVSTVDQSKSTQAHPLFPNATFTNESISAAPENVQTLAAAVHTLPPTVGMPRTLPNQYPAQSIAPRTYPPASTQGGSMPPLMRNTSHPMSSRPNSIDSGVGGSPETNTAPQSSAQNSSEESDVWGLFEKEIADFAERCEEPPAEHSKDPSIKKEMQETRPIFKILNTSELNEKAKELQGQPDLKMEPLELSEKARELHGQTITVKDNTKVAPQRTDSETVIRQFQLPTGATAPVSWNQPMQGMGGAKGITVVSALGSNIMGGQNIVVRGPVPVGPRGPIPVNVSLPQYASVMGARGPIPVSASVMGARGPVPANINVLGVRGMMPANLNVVGVRGQNPVLGRVTPPLPGTVGSRITTTVQMASGMPTPSVIMPSSDGSQTRLNFPIRKTVDGKVVMIQDGKDLTGSSQSNPRPIVVHMSGTNTSKVIIPIQNMSKEFQNQQRQQLQQQQQVAVTVPGGAAGNMGPDGKDSYYPPLSNRLQGPNTIRLVNPSSLINSTAASSQPSGMQRGTPPPLIVGAPLAGGSPVTGTAGMGVRLTNPVILTNPAMRGQSPVRPNMGSSPIRGGRGVSPARPIGSPGASPVRGAIPPGGRGSALPPGGRGGPPARGAPGARMIRPPMRGRGGVRMRGAPGGPIRGAPGGPLVRGMRPRMPMGRGGPGMRGRGGPPGVRGAPRGPRPGGPVRPPAPGSATPPGVPQRVDPANLPPAPKPKRIKVEVVDLSDEESPPTTPGNPALDRLKNCGISVSRQKAPTIPKGLKLPPGISLSPAPTGYSSGGGRRNSESREGGGGGSSYSIRPATEEAPKASVAAPPSSSGSDEVKINVQTLTDEQKNALKAMGLL